MREWADGNYLPRGRFKCKRCARVLPKRERQRLLIPWAALKGKTAWRDSPYCRACWPQQNEENKQWALETFKDQDPFDLFQ